jgi:hypothetical protein
MFRGACIVGGVVATALLLVPARAHAYEFWLHADTIGQAYQLRDFQLVGPDLILGRHIVTQTLALRITDIGDLSLHRRTARLPDRGLRISWQSYIRVDHDFGNYTNGQIAMPGQSMDALDVIPELAYDVTGIELMYGYLTLEGLLDDRLRVDVGRVLVDDGWGTTAIDGANARYDVPQVPIEVSAIAGLRVRASSPLGVAAYELDGTSGAGCQAYVAGPTPGTGTWQLIDRNRTIENYPFSSDYAYCPQRDVDQPSIGVTVATHGIHGFSAEVGYRRTWSDSAAIYPDEFGQLPPTGVDEERVFARAHGDFTTGDGVTVEPYGDLRYSILNGVFDRADFGVRLKTGDNTFEPAVEYYYPTFDGDSIFNAFSIDATTDLRLGYKWDGHGPWHVTADAWLRKYANADGLPDYAGGGDAGVQRTLGPNWRGSIDALADGGYGGRRVGGTATAAWKPTQLFWLRGRFIVLDVAEDASAGDPVGGTTPPHYVTSSANISSTYRVAEWAAVHLIGEADRDAIYGTQTRVLAVLDLAFKPEM